MTSKFVPVNFSWPADADDEDHIGPLEYRESDNGMSFYAWVEIPGDYVPTGGYRELDEWMTKTYAAKLKGKEERIAFIGWIRVTEGMPLFRTWAKDRRLRETNTPCTVYMLDGREIVITHEQYDAEYPGGYDNQTKEVRLVGDKNMMVWRDV